MFTQIIQSLLEYSLCYLPSLFVKLPLLLFDITAKSMGVTDKPCMSIQNAKRMSRTIKNPLLSGNTLSALNFGSNFFKARKANFIFSQVVKKF